MDFTVPWCVRSVPRSPTQLRASYILRLKLSILRIYMMSATTYTKITDIDIRTGKEALTTVKAHNREIERHHYRTNDVSRSVADFCIKRPNH